jgi:uncharacterized protein YlxW (UPF0749 family)
MTSPPGARPSGSARLLAELVTNHLDPGYAAAAQRRGPDAPRRRYDQPAVAAGCLLIGFLLVVAYVHTHRGAPEAATVHDGLVKQVRAAQSAVGEFENRANALQRQLSNAQARALPNSAPLAKDLDLARLEAGLVAVSGPGVTVTLREPPTAPASPSVGRGGTGSLASTNILTDRDVRSVVNELWRDGAEAISVNDVRLTPTSAIRFAGEAVVVGDNYEPVTSPYEIRALGNADSLSTNFADSAVASRYQTLSGVEHIGFSFADSDHLTLPASAPVRVRYATVPTATRHGHR